jgi:hypothetical protein
MQTSRKRAAARHRHHMPAPAPSTAQTVRKHPVPFLLAGVAVLIVPFLAAAAIAPHLHIR